VASERYVYDKLGNMVQSISPKQYATITDTATYTSENIINTNVTLVTTVGDNYTYSSAGLVTTTTDPCTNKAAYKYDNYGNKTEETLPNGLVYTYTYDKLNRPTAKNYLDNTTAVILEKYEYPAQSNGVVRRPVTRYFSASESAVTTNVYDYANRLLKTEYPDGGAVSNTYLPNGLLESSSDALGNITYFEYNPMKKMTKRWSPHENNTYSLTEWEYDEYNRVKAEKSYITPLTKGASPSGSYSSNSYKYSTDSLVSEITHNGAGKTTYEYNNDKLVSREKKLLAGSRTRQTDYTYTKLNKVETETVYQEQNALDSKPDNTTLFGVTTKYDYDFNGNTTSVTYANGGVVSFVYDAMNRLTAEKRDVLNESNAKVSVQKEQAYTSLGQVKSKTDEKGNVTSYEYNTRGFLTRVTLPNNAITAYEYDRQGRKIKEYSPRALLLDEPGNVVAPPTGMNNWANPASYTANNYTEFKYDTIDRLLTKTEFYRPTYTSTVRSIADENNTYNKRGDLLTSADALGYTTT
jgi:YD repeat-containing protein